jgi:hypothetical protein
VDDQWLSWLGPYLHQPLDVKSMEAAFAEFQRRQADLKRRQQEAAEFGGQCKKKEETKSAVDELLAKARAKAAATPMTPADSGLAAQTDAAINDGRAAANGAIAAGNAQIMSTMQDMQLQALQQQALQEQAARAAVSPPIIATTAPPPAKTTAPATTAPPASEGCVLTEADIAQGLVCVGN